MKTSTFLKWLGLVVVRRWDDAGRCRRVVAKIRNVRRST
jgi:hypothetical protein